MKFTFNFNLLLILLIGSSQNIFAQRKDSVEKTLFRLNSVNIGLGMISNQSVPTKQNDYKKIAPDNFMVNSDLSSYRFTSSGTNFNASLALFAGFNRYSKKHKKYLDKRENRIGLKYYSENILSSTYTKENIILYDSLMVNHKYYKDVTVDTTSYYNYDIRNNNIMLDLGTTFGTSKQRLLRGYLAYNIGVGYTFSSEAEAFYHRSVSLSGRLVSDYKSLEMRSEFTPLNNSYLLSGSLGWGIDLQLAHTHKLWSHCVVNVDFRSGVNSQNISGYGMFTRTFITSHFSIKYLI